MEFESHRTGLDVSYPCQKKGTENFTVGRSLLNASGNLFQKPLTGGLLQQPNEGLDLGTKLNLIGIQLYILGSEQGNL